MEYEYLHDSTTGLAKANFSLDHQVIGPWLETEIANDIVQVEKLLTAIDQVEHDQSKEVTISGKEYSVVLNAQDVVVAQNGYMNGAEPLPEALTADALDFDSQGSASCGIDDFRQVVLSWAKFRGF